MAVILCIDDCENGLAVRKLLLEAQGHTILTALTAEEGLQQFQANPVDLVISDHCLKEANGTEIARAMKHYKPEVPFILLSGHIEPPEDIRAVDIFVTKGGGAEELLAIVAEMLHSRQCVA
jgi:DNA-binding NtrC family response regulator